MYIISKNIESVNTKDPAGQQYLDVSLVEKKVLCATEFEQQGYE